MAELNVISALNGQVLQTYSTSTPEQIANCMAQARLAAGLWAAMPIQQRLRHLATLRSLLVQQMDTITDLLVTVTGKVKTEALLGELYPVLELLRYYEQHAAAILAPRSAATSPFAFPDAKASIERRPFGVVAVISPWNFPLQLTLNPMITALVTGNAVVFKTSELSVPVGDFIVSLCQQAGFPANLVQQVIGAGDVGASLLDNHPDLVFMTGGLQAGRAIMAKAAQYPIPVILELGGNDAMVVLEDANLKRVVKAAMYGAFSNSGQVCVSVERLYVQQSCYDSVVHALCQAVANISVGHGDQGDIGALSHLPQFETVKAHYDDAIAKGAKASNALELHGRYVRPVVLWNVNHQMRVMQEETFGALLPVMPFTHDAEAIALANESEFGLNASVWSQDIARAEHIARQLQVGNWAVNDVIKNIGHAGLPFGGVKRSGFGRYHGAEGLRQFTYTVSGLTSYSQLEDEPNWFPYSTQRYQEMRGFIDCLFGQGLLLERIKRNWPALQAFRGYASSNLRQHWHNLGIFLGKGRDY
jgi:acyl-CoA reductase-like NAD-dependent aldehyde dehydrogenase